MKTLLVMLITALTLLGVVAVPALAEPPSAAPGFANNWWPLVVDGKYYVECTPAEATTYFIGVEPRMTPGHGVFMDVNSTRVFIWQGEEFYLDPELTEPTLNDPDFNWWVSNPGKAANTWVTGEVITGVNPPPPEGYPAGTYIYFKLYGVWTPK